ncbi:hypothetical protein L2249_00850 [Xanthomonas perforans]|uniref:hypothetical protein n=1 Tax=Xanthomonas TaxID=338 RepID=UPI001F43DB60|nr:MULTISPECIES: hypothetical protein [Xanthomonas]MCC8549531.1 hypothetical protein [Xanthomonas perforans]MCF5926518.1 hypothetical protein [Xanthomonas perforans]MCF5941918.1 hypothetical protein [Xanthomonas perforans]MCF5963099.1 hypothetical protein [Xanthomonas perforans]MCF6048471.1 hypothetical protein [Xanthomonas perforans]
MPNPPSKAAIEAEQNKAAAASDIAADAAAKVTPRLVDEDDYPELQPGPALTAPALIKVIAQLAQALRSQADTAPGAVEHATGLKLPSDAKGRRYGARGALEKVGYEVAVWKPYAKHPGHLIEVSVSPPGSCELTMDAVQAPLLSAGFRMTKPGFGDDHRIMFDKHAGQNLGAYIAVKTDNRNDPHCVSRVTFELEPIDG